MPVTTLKAFNFTNHTIPKDNSSCIEQNVIKYATIISTI